MSISVVWDRVTGGYVGFINGVKVAVLSIEQQMQPDPNKMSGSQVAAWRDHGQIPMERLPSESWVIHFTSPSLHLGELKAIIATLPIEA